jgi:hypothetical protein
MPTPTIPDGELFMNATTYTGNGTAGRVITVPNMTNVGFAWVKLRSGVDDHRLANTVTGGNKHLKSNSTDAESSSTNVIQAFSSNTFTVGSDVSVNGNGSTYIGWTWADGGAAVTNTAGTISSQVSANTTSGFSVVTYTGTGANATVGHGLGVTPAMFIVKARNAAGNDWVVNHISLPSRVNDALVLNSTTSTITISGEWYQAPNSTTFGIGPNVSGSGLTYVAYCWAPIAGYSAFGSYTGNGSSDGPFVYLGFRPRFIMFKNTTNVSAWNIFDTSRDQYNVAGQYLQANTSGTEGTATAFDFLSNGFKVRTTSNFINASGDNYIYMAFCENPLKYSNAR